MVKTLNLSFSEQEFKRLRRAYEIAPATSWEKFFIECADMVLENEELAV